MELGRCLYVVNVLSLKLVNSDCLFQLIQKPDNTTEWRVIRTSASVQRGSPNSCRLKRYSFYIRYSFA